MALAGHSGMHTAQSMHSSGSMVKKLGPSRKQSTGQTSTQSVYLHWIQDSETTWVMMDSEKKGSALSDGHGSLDFKGDRWPPSGSEPLLTTGVMVNPTHGRCGPICRG